MKYVVSYVVDRYLKGEDNLDYYKPEGRTLIVQGDNRVQAFIAAYKQLTAQGHMVRTVSSTAGYTVVGPDGSSSRDWSLAGLDSAEMQEVYKSGVPQVRPGYDQTAMTHIKEIREFDFVRGPHQASIEVVENGSSFIDPDRLNQLRTITSSKFDLTKLIRLCEEVNSCYAGGSYFAVAMLTRAIQDHVPPIFGFDTFSELVNNYKGTRSFKEQMGHLQNSSRKIADAHLHAKVRDKEILPSKTQVNFSSDVDVLLAEIVRILK